MDCTNARSLLDGYLDHELDRKLSTKLEEHLDACDDCSRTVAARASLGTMLKKEASYYPAGPALASRIRAGIRQTTAQREGRLRKPRFKLLDWNRWLPLGGAVVAGALVASVATLQVASAPQDDALVAQLINGRSRSIVTGHQIDVASSDQHTVKPWLSSKLDFSPNVIDLAASGFPLRGGRLDYVNNRAVAVLVYGHHEHLIDLYIWPEDTARDSAASRALSRRGVNVLHWTAGGMTHWAVSDINEADLKEFEKHYTSG